MTEADNLFGGRNDLGVVSQSKPVFAKGHEIIAKVLAKLAVLGACRKRGLQMLPDLIEQVRGRSELAALIVQLGEDVEGPAQPVLEIRIIRQIDCQLLPELQGSTPRRFRLLRTARHALHPCQMAVALSQISAIPRNRPGLLHNRFSQFQRFPVGRLRSRMLSLKRQEMSQIIAVGAESL